jgi:hypothetical protein
VSWQHHQVMVAAQVRRLLETESEACSWNRDLREWLYNNAIALQFQGWKHNQPTHEFVINNRLERQYRDLADIHRRRFLRGEES